MNEKKYASFNKDIVALAALLNETDRAARKVLTQNAGSPADLSALRSCTDRLNKNIARQEWKEKYTGLRNSIAQGENAVETVEQMLKKNDSDVQRQYKLLNEFKDKIGTDPANRDLIRQMEMLQRIITPGADKTGDILALGKSLEQVAQERRKELRETIARKQIMDYLFVVAMYEQRLGFCALANPGALIWNKLAQELHIPALPEKERTCIFDFLGKQKLAPVARQIYDALHTVINEPEEKVYDFSTKEGHRAVKKDTIEKMKKIARVEKLCREALDEDTEQYRELMKAQDALLTKDAEEMSLSEMQKKLQTLQKASQTYMEAQVEKGGIFGVPRKEARLVYAAALHNFAGKFALQLGEAMRCSDIASLGLPGDMAKDYIKNSLLVMNRLIEEQTGEDLTKENKAPEKNAVLRNSLK